MQLLQLHDVLKELYEFENGQVKQSKTHGTQLISHFILSTTGFVDKFGVYVQHMDNVITDSSKQCDRATLQRKHDQLVQAEVLLKCSVFIDILQSPKKFSLASQFKDIDIMLLVERMDDMKLTYQRFFEKFEQNPNSLFELPTVRKVLEHIETNEANQVYQGVSLKYFERAKASVDNNICDNIRSILLCLEDLFEILVEDADEVHDDHEQHLLSGDEILHKVCCVLDNRNWVLQKNTDITEENVSIYFEKQLNTVEFIFRHYEDIFKITKYYISFDKVRDEFVNIVMLTTTNVTGVQPKQFGNFIHQRKDNKEWDHIMLLIELCWCAPFSNATLERFFSQMKVVKTDWRNRLGAENISHLLRIKLEGPNFAEFRKDFCKAAMNIHI